MRISQSVTVAAPAAAVWERVCDPMRWPRDLGRMRCSHLGDTPRSGVGARYWLHLEVGAAEVGSLIEILEYEPQTGLSWTTIRGFEQRGHWRLRQCEAGTELTLGVSYQASGGLAALATDELSSVFVRRYLREALSTLARRLQSPGNMRAAPTTTPLLARGATALGDAARLAGSLTRTALAKPARPDRYPRSLAALARSGPAAAGRYAALGVLHPDAPAVIDEQGTLTFARLCERTSRLASALADHGIGAGSTVALMCRNHRGFVEAFLACSMLGAHRLLLDPQLPKPALTALLGGERPQAIVYDAELSRPLNALPRDSKRFLAWAQPAGNNKDGTLEELIAASAPDRRVPLVGYEGRTTILTPGARGTPERATHPAPPLSAVLSIIDSIRMQPGGRMLVSAPLGDRCGVMCLSIASLLMSALVLQREFDAESALAMVEHERVASWVLTATMLERVLELPAKVSCRYDTGSLRSVLVGDGPLLPALASRFMDEYGEILHAIYMTNRVDWVTIAQPKDLRRAPGTVGRAPRHTIVRVLDEDGVSLLPGQTGRIFAANRMLADRGDCEEIEVFDGLMATGDIGHLDDHGRLFLDGPVGGGYPEREARSASSSARA